MNKDINNINLQDGVELDSFMKAHVDSIPKIRLSDENIKAEANEFVNYYKTNVLAPIEAAKTPSNKGIIHFLKIEFQERGVWFLTSRIGLASLFSAILIGVFAWTILKNSFGPSEESKKENIAHVEDSSNFDYEDLSSSMSKNMNKKKYVSPSQEDKSDDSEKSFAPKDKLEKKAVLLAEVDIETFLAATPRLPGEDNIETMQNNMAFDEIKRILKDNNIGFSEKDGKIYTEWRVDSKNKREKSRLKFSIVRNGVEAKVKAVKEYYGSNRSEYDSVLNRMKREINLDDLDL